MENIEFNLTIFGRVKTAERSWNGDELNAWSGVMIFRSQTGWGIKNTSINSRSFLRVCMS